MPTYSLPETHGIEPVVVMETSLQGIRAYGFAFDDNADIVAETDSRQFIDYCRVSVASAIVSDMLDTLTIAHGPLYAYLERAGMGPCTCIF